MADIILYSIDEVASILKVTPRTIYNHIKNKSLKATKVGKYWRVRLEDLERFLHNGTSLEEEAEE